MHQGIYTYYSNVESEEVTVYDSVVITLQQVVQALVVVDQPGAEDKNGLNMIIALVYLQQMKQLPCGDVFDGPCGVTADGVGPAVGIACPAVGVVSVDSVIPRRTVYNTQT